jgi:hypothetical protein
MTQGYFLIALGKRYVEECWVLSNTIRKQGDQRPISLLIHPEDEEYARSFNMFDKLVHFTPSDQLWQDCTTGFEKYCLYPRLYLNDLTPYNESITVDSDMICQYNADHVWAFCKARNFKSPITMLGRDHDPSWHWGYINEVSKTYGKEVRHTHGGFFYLKKDPFLDIFFRYCKELFYLYDQYNCRRMFRGGKVDEIIFAIAHSYFDMKAVDFEDFPIMTFNYSPALINSTPSKLQTEGGRYKELENYIPFVHMFDKMEGENFFWLYKKVMHND